VSSLNFDPPVVFIYENYNRKFQLKKTLGDQNLMNSPTSTQRADNYPRSTNRPQMTAIGAIESPKGSLGVISAWGFGVRGLGRFSYILGIFQKISNKIFKYRSQNGGENKKRLQSQAKATTTQKRAKEVRKRKGIDCKK